MEAVPQGGGTATWHGVAMEAVKNGIFANGEAIREKPLGGFLWVADPSPLLPHLYSLSILAYWNHRPLPLPPITYAPTSTTRLYHLYHLYYPGGEMPKKVCWSKAKCIAAPHLWDLDHSEAWRGHPLAKKPRSVRAHALCADCPLIRDCAVYALTATPRMAGVVMAGVDIPIAGGAKAEPPENSYAR